MNANLSMARRMTLGFSIAPLLLLLLAIYSLSNLATLRDQATTIVAQDWPKVSPIMLIATGVRDNARNTRDLLLNKDDSAARERINVTKQRITQALDALEPLMYLPKGQALFQQLKTQRQAYVSAFTSVLALVQQGQMAEANQLLLSQVVPAEAQVYQALDALMTLQSDVFAERGNDATSIYASTRNNMLSILLVCIVLVAIAAVLVTRSVIRPLGGEPHAAAQTVRQIAKGDLTSRVEVQLGDRDSLMADMQGMQKNLREVISGISGTVNMVASSSEELSAVSRETTQALQQQSSEIEQAATAVNEMTAAVDEVARNAVSASQYSRQSEDAAQRGLEQVLKTVHSIDALTTGVTDTSQRIEQLAARVHGISTVLDVIRSIADQTNLLALNAAIEAARAGEAGRGFAVVADEVRALAHRTQQSTQEIEQMIGQIRQDTESAVSAMQTSNNLADSTMNVAKAAGEALEEITQSISEINQRTLVIASATEEQAQVSREVDRNLMGIRDLSLQILQGAQQTDEAGQELTRMASALSGSVAHFTV